MALASPIPQIREPLTDAGHTITRTWYRFLDAKQNNAGGGATGPAGATGPDGPAGPDGPQGEQGPIGPAGGVSGSGAVTASAGAATLNSGSGVVTSEALTGPVSYTLTLSNSLIVPTSTVLVTPFNSSGTQVTIQNIAPGAGQAIITLTFPALTGTVKIPFVVIN